MAKDILVVAEHEDGKLRRGTFEALALARNLAQDLGGRVLAAVLGEKPSALAEELARRGADEVFLFDSPVLRSYSPEPYRRRLVALVRELAPEWVLLGHTYAAQDLLPLVSAAFGAPVVSDAIAASVHEGRVVFVRQPYDAKFIARTVDRGPAPHFATLQAGAFPADSLPDSHAGVITPRPVEDSPDDLVPRRVLEVRTAGDKTVDLSSAQVIVAGGRGLGSKEKFEQLVGGLARALNGAMGASRPVVDNEWLPHEYQIGSSGQSVAPRLYFAIGISGAIQHVVGVRGAQVIVAINKDKDAPIFNEATYGLVGDLAEIVPELIKAVEEAKAS